MSDTTIDEEALDTIFRTARTFSSWQDRPVSRPLLQAVYDLARMGPTSANCSPARFVFVCSGEAKERLKPHLAEGNVQKTMSAPCCVIIAHDMEFYEKLPDLFPHADAKSWFADNDALAAETAFRNGSLQGAYFMIAARALGLDCGPMSGFDPDGLNAGFFAGTTFRANFLCNVGYGSNKDLYSRSPRLSFDDACRIL